MLNALRDRSAGPVAKVVIALLIISFAVWGMGDLSGGGRLAEVASAGDVVITRQDVERELRRDIDDLRARLGENFKPEFIGMLNLPQQIATRLVSQQLFALEAKSLGLMLPDSEVAARIRQNPAFAGDDGEFNKDYFLRILKSSGLSERDYVDRFGEQLSADLLRQAVASSNHISDARLAILLAADSEKREVTLHTIRTDVENITPSEEEILAHYHQTASQYTIPEYRKVSYITLAGRDIADRINPTDEELSALYIERRTNYTLPETRDVEQLLYNDQETATKAAAMLTEKKDIKRVAANIKPVNEGQMSLKGITKNELPESAAQTVFSTGLSDVTAPIESSFGWHVFKVTGVHASAVQPFEKVKQSLVQEVKSESIGRALTESANQFEDLLAGGTSFTEAAKELGLSVTSTDLFAANGTAPNGKNVSLPQLKNFAQLAFSGEEGTESAMALGAPGLYYMIHIDSVQPESVTPLSEVKTKVIADLKQSKKAHNIQAMATSIAAQLGHKKTYDKAAAALTKLASGTVTRRTETLGNITLPAPLRSDLFQAQTGSHTQAHPLNDTSFVIAHIARSTLPNLADVNIQSEAGQTLKNNLIRSRESERMEQLQRYLFDKYNARIDQNMLTQITNDYQQ